MGIARIICVDDTETEAVILQKVLINAGYDVDIASSGTTALEMMKQNQYDLAVIDQIMPEQTGLELLSVLSKVDNKLATIMLTAHNEPEVANHAYELGANHFIVKDNLKKYLSNVSGAVRQTLIQQRTLAELAREKRKVERINLNLMLLNSTSHLLTSTQNIEQITTRLTQTIASVLHTQGSTVWVRPQDNEAEELICGAAYSQGRHIDSSDISLPVSEGIAGWVARNSQTVMSNDLQNDPRFSSSLHVIFNYEQKTMLAVPLICQGELIGVLQLINKQHGNFDSTDCTLAETLAAFAANAIVNARLMDQLREQNTELALQNADLDAYSDSVAHDLKNPITHFLGYADDLRENFATMPPEEIKSHLAIIIEQSHRMNGIVEELLLLARIRMNPVVDVDFFDMNEVVQNALGRLAYEIDETQAQIRIPEPLPLSVGYGPWIEGVWANYISNGLRHGGTPPQLTINAIEQPDGMIRYQVSDNGEGLTENERALLFKPFPKIKPSTAGNGLGLVIVRRVIERLNGTFGVESNLGQGSSFYFTLPSAR